MLERRGMTSTDEGEAASDMSSLPSMVSDESTLQRCCC